MILGPIIMGEPEDTLEMIEDISLRQKALTLPNWPTSKLHHAEEVLSAVAAIVSENVQSRYGSFVYKQDKILSELYELKNELSFENKDSDYFIRSEKQITSLIAAQDKEGAQRLLNELLGYIFLTVNADLQSIKARLIEILVMLSRSAIDAGAGVDEILFINAENLKQIQKLTTIEDLSLWTTVIMHRFIHYCFDFSSVKHSDIMHKVIQYVKANYDKKITLDDVASHVYLSRSYLSSMFKEEMGESLFAYVNRIRIEKSKVLLLNEAISLVNVGGMCGFDDQSYFTKVFKKIVGISPKRFRECRGKTESLKLLK